MAIQKWNGMTMLAFAAELNDEARSLCGRAPPHCRDVDFALFCQDEARDIITEAKADAEAIWAEEVRLVRLGRDALA